MTDTQTAVVVLRSLAAAPWVRDVTEPFAPHLIWGGIRGRRYPYLAGTHRVYARAAVALHRADGVNLAERCSNAARALGGAQ